MTTQPYYIDIAPENNDYLGWRHDHESGRWIWDPPAVDPNTIVSPNTHGHDSIMEMERALNVLHPPENLIEIRTLKPGSAGYYWDRTDAVWQVTRERYDATYTLLNRIANPRVMFARTGGRLKRGQKPTTADKEIDRRQWIMIDIDPIREGGVKGVSSSQSELDTAVEAPLLIRDSLIEMGWPNPVECLSGNGYHCLFPTDLPNDAESSERVKDVLIAVDGWIKFHHPVLSRQIDMDKGVFNAGRPTKLYGSMARKGEPTEAIAATETTEAVEARPHRYSRLVSVPEELDWANPERPTVSPEMMDAVINAERSRSSRGYVGATPPTYYDFSVEMQRENASASAGSNGRVSGRTRNNSSSRNTNTSSGRRLNVERWLNDREIEYQVVEEPAENRTKYVLAECPFDPLHTDPDAAIFQYESGSLGFRCLHTNTCIDHDWQAAKEQIGPPDPEHWEGGSPGGGEKGKQQFRHPRQRRNDRDHQCACRPARDDGGDRH